MPLIRFGGNIFHVLNDIFHKCYGVHFFDGTTDSRYHPVQIDFGLPVLMERKWQSLKGLLMIPFEGQDSK